MQTKMAWLMRFYLTFDFVNSTQLNFRALSKPQVEPKLLTLLVSFSLG